MTTKQIESIKYDTMYVAVDGTEFYDKEQCEAYEKSAKCVIRAAIKDIIIETTCEYSLFDTGSDDSTAEVMIPRNENDITRINQLYFLINKDTGKSDWVPVTNDDIGKVIIFDIGYNEDWACVMKLNNLVDRISGGRFTLVPNPDKQ